MAFRFFRRIRIAPGIRMNLSKSGPSFSFGPRGAALTLGPRGVRTTVGLPGTGLYYTEHSSHGRTGRRRRNTAPAPVPPANSLDPGFFQRLLISKGEENFIDGLRALVEGREAAAYALLRESSGIPDAAYVAGFIAVKQQDFIEGARLLEEAARRHGELGKHLAKYGVNFNLSVAITEEFHALCIGPNLRGVLLGLVEAYQQRAQWPQAVAALKRLQRAYPEDLVSRLSFAEVLVEVYQGREKSYERVLQLTEGVENEDPIHAALLLYRGRALQGLGLHEAARTVFTAGLRRRKDRSPKLMGALRYQRALAYETLGQKARARREFERLFADQPNYRDVKARLGL